MKVGKRLIIKWWAVFHPKKKCGGRLGFFTNWRFSYVKSNRKIKGILEGFNDQNETALQDRKV